MLAQEIYAQKCKLLIQITEGPTEALDTQAIAANIDASARSSRRTLAEQMKKMPVLQQRS